MPGTYSIGFNSAQPCFGTSIPGNPLCLTPVNFPFLGPPGSAAPHYAEVTVRFSNPPASGDHYTATLFLQAGGIGPATAVGQPCTFSAPAIGCDIVFPPNVTVNASGIGTDRIALQLAGSGQSLQHNTVITVTATVVSPAQSAQIGGVHMIAAAIAFDGVVNQSVALFGGAQFTSATSYVCTATDTTSPSQTYMVNNASGEYVILTQHTLAHTTANLICVGN